MKLTSLVGHWRRDPRTGRHVAAAARARRGASRPHSLLRLDTPAPAACDPPVSACLRFDYNAGTMRGKTGAMADRASACCACSFRPLRATVRQRRTQRQKAAQAAFTVCGREEAAIDAPVPVLPIPHCTALDGQDFNACCTSIAQDFNARCISTAPCCCNSWLPPRIAQ